MAFTPFELPAGIQFKPTKAMDSVHWRESNLIRWIEGGMKPIGGWEQLSYAAPESPIRAIHTWRDNLGRSWTAYLCESHCYVDVGGVLTIVSPTDMAAASTGAVAGGFGDGTYSFGTYGTPRPPSTSRRKLGPAYSIDNWGENLVFMTSFDTRLLMWNPNTPATRATKVANSPTGRCFSVTSERFVQIFDYNGIVGEFAWCDQEDITDWNFADTLSKAGNLPYEPRASVIASKRTESGTFMFTTNNAFRIEYIGLPLIFSISPVAGGGPPVSAQSVIEVSDGLIWPSDAGWWLYNGVSISPVPSPIWEYIESKIDWNLARFTATAIDNRWFSELWWSFPSQDSTGSNDYTVVFNYRDGWWATHRMGRSAGSVANYIDYPIMAQNTAIYRHEAGSQYNNWDPYPWIESHTINVNRGGNILTLRQMEPDIEGDVADLRFSLKYRFKRMGQELQTPLKTLQSGGNVDFMQSARDMRLRVEQVTSSVQDWSIGQSLIDVVGRGGRA